MSSSHCSSRRARSNCSSWTLPPRNNFQHTTILLSLAAFLSPSIAFADRVLPVFDERRVLLVAILCICGVLGIRRANLVVPKFAQISLGAFIALGLIGALFKAASPVYALVEVTLFVLLVAAVALAGRECYNENQLRRLLLPLLGGSAVLYGTVTIMIWLIGLVAEGHRPPWPEPMHNFVNPRFMNDWQTWLLPLLPAALYAVVPNCRPLYLRCLLIAYFALLWALLFRSLGRATLYSQLACLVLVPTVFGRAGLKWAGLQAMTALLGLLLFILAFGLAPSPQTGAPAERLVSLNPAGRLELWVRSWELIQANPWLGVGPMQFAAEPGITLAHPHNAVLQVMVEWGVPAGLALLTTLAWAGWKWLRFAQRIASDKRCPAWRAALLISLTAAIAAASANSLLAGVVVMPMSQIMLPLVVGLALSLYPKRNDPQSKPDLNLKLWRGAVLASSLWLGSITAYEVTYYLKNNIEGTEFVGGGWIPRFWMQGKLLPK